MRGKIQQNQLSDSMQGEWKRVIKAAIEAASEDGKVTIDEFKLLEAISKATEDFNDFGFIRSETSDLFERRKRQIIENIILLIEEDKHIDEREERILMAVIEEMLKIMQERANESD